MTHQRVFPTLLSFIPHGTNQDYFRGVLKITNNNAVVNNFVHSYLPKKRQKFVNFHGCYTNFSPLPLPLPLPLSISHSRSSTKILKYNTRVISNTHQHHQLLMVVTLRSLCLRILPARKRLLCRSFSRWNTRKDRGVDCQPR